MFKICRRN